MVHISVAMMTNLVHLIVFSFTCWLILSSKVRSPTPDLSRVLGPEATVEIMQGNGGIRLVTVDKSILWYLNPTYNGPKQILISRDGGVRGGTLPALVERLTMHDQLDSAFVDSFLLTYKSFATIKELFLFLVERFRIAPPEGLTMQELEEWIFKKQRPARVRCAWFYLCLGVGILMDF
jgi:hypothetical protein